MCYNNVMRFKADRKFERFEDVTPEVLKEEKVELLLCDLDNTLTQRLSKLPAETVAGWIDACRSAGTEIVVVSNNIFRKRVEDFCEPFGIHCVWGAKKPMSTYLTRVREEFGVEVEHTVMLGDKYSTDMLAAHFAGIRGWKVEHRKKLVKDIAEQREDEIRDKVKAVKKANKAKVKTLKEANKASLKTAKKKAKKEIEKL